jgi:hypothetical protein
MLISSHLPKRNELESKFTETNWCAHEAEKKTTELFLTLACKTMLNLPAIPLAICLCVWLACMICSAGLLGAPKSLNHGSHFAKCELWVSYCHGHECSTEEAALHVAEW